MSEKNEKNLKFDSINEEEFVENDESIVNEEEVEEEIDEEVEEEVEEIDDEIDGDIEDIEDIVIGKEKVSNASTQDFDWDNVSKGIEKYAEDKRHELEALYDLTLSTIVESEVLEGTVIQITSREVVINIGYKSEGIVSLNEFRYNPELKIGDKVEVYVENQEDKNGQLVLSHKKARALRSWDRVNEALEKDEIIKGYIKCRTKGGMIVDVFGIEAFLPGSQIDVKPIRDYDIYVNKTMEFKVVKINHEYKNVVVSHKALIEAELEQQKKEIISKLEKGQVLEGTVKNITSYGVFIDLGGVDGLIHITDLSWGRVTHPEEIVSLDQKLNVVILDFDDEKKRIALGLKQLTPHPWDSLNAELKVGDTVKGRVVVLADYGAFVEIALGVEGLIHVSEMSWSQHLRSAQEFLKVGDEVEAVILTLDREERKMSLGIKQLKSDPWDKIEEKYSINSKHVAKVRNFTNFGVFVEIEEGVDGLIHISDLSWTKKIKHPAEFTAIGTDIEVVVLEIDKENRRLSLGHKQLEENPWDVFETIFNVDSVHEGTIVNIFDKGATIALPYGVEGFASLRHLIKEDKGQAKVEEKLEFKVIEFSKAAKRIILSHTKVWEDKKKTEEKVATDKTKKATQKKVKINLEKTTLGDITDLANLKTQLEENEDSE
jgi:small subunit ribosomal protein S1